jgi:hypothetical protein
VCPGDRDVPRLGVPHGILASTGMRGRSGHRTGAIAKRLSGSPIPFLTPPSVPANQSIVLSHRVWGRALELVDIVDAVGEKPAGLNEVRQRIDSRLTR